MKLIYNSITMLMVVMLLSCNKANDTQSEKMITQDVIMEAPLKEEEKNKSIELSGNGVSADTTAKALTDEAVLQAGQPAPIIDLDKKIIKTANVTLELTNYNAYNTSIHQNLKRYGAYVAGEEQTENEGKIENNLSIKVPVVQFEALMNILPGEGVKVLEKRISTEDVTGEVVDTKARMDAKKQVRARYMDFLKQAKNMEEII